MPIRYELPAHPDPTRADDHPDTDTDTDEPASEGATWSFYPMKQIAWLVRRLGWPTIPAAVLDPAAPLPDPTADPADDGLSVPLVMTVIGPKTAAPELVDRVWRYVIQATRTHRGAWNLYALGLARRGLHQQAAKLTAGTEPTVRRNVQHVMAAELLLELHRGAPDPTGQQVFGFDTAKPYIYARLRDHCVYMVTTRRWNRHNRGRRNLDLAGFALLHETHPNANLRSRLHHQPGRTDAYSVLARLVTQTADQRAGKRLTRTDAALIALTHLVGYPVADAAALLGLPEPAARMRQHRAVKLVAAILESEHLESEHTEDVTAPRPTAPSQRGHRSPEPGGASAKRSPPTDTRCN